VRRRILAPLAIGCALAAAPGAAQHSRLFPPENLGQLEGPDRDAWQRPDRIMDALQIGENSVVADIGAGGGWFTIRLARQVGPNGLVYAEDIQQGMINAIERRMKRENQRNVKTLLGTADDPKLPAGSMDVVLIVDAYHEIERPVALLKNVVKSLKPAGLVAIVNFKKDGGVELRKREDFLRYQYMLTFGVAGR
jgi:ubiquinone/menaquinone biosynthesis C-methylase UbiE